MYNLSRHEMFSQLPSLLADKQNISTMQKSKFAQLEKALHSWICTQNSDSVQKDSYPHQAFAQLLLTESNKLLPSDQ